MSRTLLRILCPLAALASAALIIANLAVHDPIGAIVCAACTVVCIYLSAVNWRAL
jgi:hypothetical protein